MIPILEEKILPLVLHGRKPEKLDRVIYFWGVLVAVVFLVLFMCSSCITKKETVKFNKLANKEKELDDLQGRAATIEEGFAKLNKSRKIFADNFFDKEEVSSLVTHLSGVLNERFRAGEIVVSPGAIQTTDFTWQAIGISMTCSENALINFLQYLENFSRMLEIRSLNIGRMGESKIRITINLRVYIQDEKVGALVQAPDAGTGPVGGR